MSDWQGPDARKVAYVEGRDRWGHMFSPRVDLRRTPPTRELIAETIANAVARVMFGGSPPPRRARNRVRDV